MKFDLINARIRDNAINYIATLPDTERWQVEVKPYKRGRSLAQNSLFHAWMTEISEKYAASYGDLKAPWVWKQFFKSLFLGEEVGEVRGKYVVETRHTSKLKVCEFADFLNSIEAWVVTELGFDLSHNEWYDEAMR